MNYREVGLVVVVGLWNTWLFVAMGWLLELSVTTTTALFALGASAVVAVALLAFALSVVRHRASQAALLAIPALATMVGGRFSLSALIGAFLLLLLLWSAGRILRYEMTSRTIFRLRPMYSEAIKRITLGIILAAVGLAYAWVLGGIHSGQFRLKPHHLAPALRPAEPLLQQFIPGFSSELTIDQWIDAQLEEEVRRVAPQATVAPQQRQLVREQLERQVGQRLSGQENFVTLATNLTNQRLDTAVRQYPIVVTVVILVLIFLTIRAGVPLLVWPVIGLLYLFVRLGERTGLVRLEETSQTVQRLILL